MKQKQVMQLTIDSLRLTLWWVGPNEVLIIDYREFRVPRFSILKPTRAVGQSTNTPSAQHLSYRITKHRELEERLALG
jgi:hypothetical protein